MKATRIKTHIGQFAMAALVAGSLVAGFGGGAASAQQKEQGEAGMGCYLAGIHYEEGALAYPFGMAHICKNGEWVIYTRPLTVAPADRTVGVLQAPAKSAH